MQTSISTPDILTCIASLGKDEVFTPPDLANEMLDLLPSEIWTIKDLKILDPVSKTGVFLREAAKRLDYGLKDVIKNDEKRREHIFKNMLYGIAVSDLTSLISKRTLYYTKDASSNYSAVKFDRKDGNLYYDRNVDHEFNDKSCIYCGASKIEFNRSNDKEKFAYQFIHEENPFDMKFDVIIGNPPYHIGDGSGKAGESFKPIYGLFVEQAMKLKPRYLCMITPSRWFIGGKGLDNFRKNMLNSNNFKELVHFPIASEVFSSQGITGGVSYFLWDSLYDGECNITVKEDYKIVSSSKRNLNSFGKYLIIRDEEVSIINKVQEVSSKFMNDVVSSRNPFGIKNNNLLVERKPNSNYLKVYTQEDKFSFIDKNEITKNSEWINKYKVILGKAYGGRKDFPHPIINSPIIAEPGSVCSESKLVIGVFDSKAEAVALCEYLTTKFARLLIFTLKKTQNITKEVFTFLPALESYKTIQNDKKLYKKYKLTSNEIEYIEDRISEITYEV